MSTTLGTQIIEFLRKSPKSKAGNIARALGRERREVNSVLYGELKVKVQKDAQHRWSLSSGATNSPSPSRPTEESMSGVVPTPSQEKLIAFKPDGALLINGQAGSGKTTVLAARAGWLQTRLRTGSMLFVTYNRALASYVEAMLGQGSALGDVHVTTYHKWAEAFATRMGQEMNGWVNTAERKALLGSALRALPPEYASHRLVQRSVDEFWSDEMEWIYGQGIRSGSKYQQAERVGRGTAIPVRANDRDVVWRVFSAVDKQLSSQARFDYANPAGLIRAAVKAKGNQYHEDLKYDHVFIDEVQDFDKSWLMAISPIPRVTLTMAGDLAQRIYKRSFTWRGVGIDLPAARSKKLAGSHRTTRQIMEVARHLVDHTGDAGSVEGVETELPSRNGPPVVRIQRPKWWQAQDAALDQVASLTRACPTQSIVVAVPFNGNFEKVLQSLSRRGVRAKSAKHDALARFSRGVAVTTYHQLKGLEFDHLVLLSLQDSTIPGWWVERAPSGDEEHEAVFLKRLVYVALTRAKHSVTIAGATPFSRFFDGVPAAALREL
jgi:superfamily I DNA/RNA helicase